MFVGNIWILIRSIFYKTPIYPQQPVAQLGEIPVGGVKLFTYPTKEDHCILVRTAEDEYVELQPEMHASFMRCLLFAGKQTGWNARATRASFRSRTALSCKDLRHAHCRALFSKHAVSNWLLSR